MKRMISGLDRSPPIPFTDEALEGNLRRLENEFETYKSTRDRDAIYPFLTAIYELVSCWDLEGIAVVCARRALRLRGRRPIPKNVEPFAAVIRSIAPQLDYRTVSKWSRTLRYAAKYDTCGSLTDFIRRKGGINRCTTRYARCLRRVQS